MKPGDRVLSMDLSNGGHLSHGSPVNFSGMYYDVKSYGINENGEIDYEDVRKMAIEHKPKLIICGASNYAKVIDFKNLEKLQMKSVHYCWLILHILQGLWLQEFIRPLLHIVILLQQLHINLFADHAAELLCAKKSLLLQLIKLYSLDYRADRLNILLQVKAVALLEASKPEFKEYAEQIVKMQKLLLKV